MVDPRAFGTSIPPGQIGFMRIAAHLGVKDEVELIEDAITHLRAIGVDHIVAVDGFSKDGTADILAQHRNKDDFWVVRLDDLEPDGKVWLQRNLEAIAGVRADWMLFLDADERWLPATGSLHDCAGLAQADMLSVARFNVVLAENGAMMPASVATSDYDDILLYVEAIPGFRTHLDDHPDTPWIRGVPGRKAMARPERIGGLTDGMHDIVANDGPPLRQHKPDDLLIAHLPFTTLPRFERKVANIRRSLLVHDEYCGDSLAWHWRRWLALDDAGRTEEEFEHQAVDADAIPRLRQQGIIRSAAEWLRDAAGVDAARPLR
jgi:glycosyltransferase involved in cell wall biosynthesis